MHSLRKSLLKTYITLLCKYYCFGHKRVRGGVKYYKSFNCHSILMQFFAKCPSLWVIDRPYKIVCYSKKGFGRDRNFAYLKGI